jgi:hypothetical protein
MLQTEAYPTIVNYDRETFIAQVTDIISESCKYLRVRNCLAYSRGASFASIMFCKVDKGAVIY